MTESPRAPASRRTLRPCFYPGPNGVFRCVCKTGLATAYLQVMWYPGPALWGPVAHPVTRRGDQRYFQCTRTQTKWVTPLAGNQPAWGMGLSKAPFSLPWLHKSIKDYTRLLVLALIDFGISKDVNFKKAAFGDISLYPIRTLRASSILIWGPELFRVQHWHA